MFEPDRLLDLGDVTLAVDDRGSGDATPLVLVHGFTGGRIDFSDVIDDLAADRRVIAWDHRGHSESTNTGDVYRYTLEHLADDAWRALDELGIGRFHLLGHSMGGAVVQLMVLARPNRVTSLVLMDTSPNPMSVPTEWIDRYATMGRNEGMTAVADALGALSGPYSVAPEEDRPHIAARNHHKLVHMDVEAYVGFARALRDRESLLSRLADIACPTTIIVGELDQSFREPSEQLASTIPGAELVVIDGAAHCPQEDRRGAWLAAVHAHLGRAEPATG
jgi:pimeloyl-ACP methyl ester carboxylesterase